MRLEPIAGLIPASYNPRTVDPLRLALVRLSLQKLGWLLPVFAAGGDEILSGHQRTHVAPDLGYTHVPAVRLDIPDENTRKAINILFNRSTNDFALAEDSATGLSALQAAPIEAMADRIPDHPIDRFPCMEAETMDIAPFVRVNSGRWVQYACNVAKSLYGYGILMPIIVDEQGLVVNGIGRLQMLAEKKLDRAQFIVLDANRAEFARLMLNALSMDFAIAERYADLLRYNSFRRARRTRDCLGRGFVFAVQGNKAAKEFDILDPTDRAKWVTQHGRTVLDFGAGHLTETHLLREAGIDCTPFEPYHCTAGDEIDKAASLAIVRDFLSAIADGKPFSSVFISSVLNSVPFEQDRKHIVKIAAALCSPPTRVYAIASSDNQTGYRNMDAAYLNDNEVRMIKTRLDYEPGIVLGDLSRLPKVQKYHTPEEFYGLFKSAFHKVHVHRDTQAHNVCAIAGDRLPLDGLRASLEFEFDLPYPDGSRMGLVSEAIAAFERRLGCSL